MEVAAGGGAQRPRAEALPWGDSPACASGRRTTRGTARPAGRGPCSWARGGQIKDGPKRPAMRPLRSRGVGARAWGWDLLLSPGAAPLSPLAEVKAR